MELNFVGVFMAQYVWCEFFDGSVCVVRIQVIVSDWYCSNWARLILSFRNWNLIIVQISWPSPFSICRGALSYYKLAAYCVLDKKGEPYHPCWFWAMELKERGIYKWLKLFVGEVISSYVDHATVVSVLLACSSHHRQLAMRTDN